ncbi:hypothetical protein FKP32DRAFT_788014 [Trametes sanguinea]|nr:hypothetical protein FKP32DRAFT_788014 [Trametes sanguinea]
MLETGIAGMGIQTCLASRACICFSHITRLAFRYPVLLRRIAVKSEDSSAASAHSTPVAIMRSAAFKFSVMQAINVGDTAEQNMGKRSVLRSMRSTLAGIDPSGRKRDVLGHYAQKAVRQDAPALTAMIQLSRFLQLAVAEGPRPSERRLCTPG